MQKHGKFLQTRGACIVRDPPRAAITSSEESKTPASEEAPKEVEMREESVDLPHKDKEITVLYFGAGRGPLIRRALAAAK